MKIFKTSKAAGIACIVLSCIFVALSLVLLFNPDEENLIGVSVVGFLLAAVLLIIGLISIISPIKSIFLEDQKIIFKNCKVTPKDAHFDSEKKEITIAVSDIVNMEVKGADASSSFLAGFLGGAIGAAILSSKNPDKLILTLKDTELTIFVPRLGAEKLKKALEDLKTKEEAEALKNVAAINPSIDEENKNEF